ncbi:hypothetical protein UEF14_24100 [Klebsiella michiganensis]|uniref:hypothetical protein n=1 Tax=Klebsiella michiganensis TaxID=1134687 RepID=UPI0039BFC201
MKSNNMHSNKTQGQSIWHKNGIPALEYCTLPRASELLDCKMCDLLHLSSVGAIRLGILLNEFEASVWIGDAIDIKPEIFVSHAGDIVGGKIDSLGRFTSNVHPLSRVRFETQYDNEFSTYNFVRDEKAEIRHNLWLANLTGLWYFQSHYEWETSMINRGAADVTKLGLVFYPADTQLSQTSIKAYLRGEKIPYEIRYDVITELTPNDIYISRKQLEVIYDSIGKELPNYINYGVERPLGSEARSMGIEINSNKMGEFLEMLIRSIPELGDEVMQASANKRYSILNAFLESKQAQGKFLDMKLPASATIEKYFKI